MHTQHTYVYFAFPAACQVLHGCMAIAACATKKMSLILYALT
jgi:hypothetical protein